MCRDWMDEFMVDVGPENWVRVRDCLVQCDSPIPLLNFILERKKTLYHNRFTSLVIDSFVAKAVYLLDL
jgi:hypothetical protein